jgi:NADPH-dependent glutamate synthase beta chain and related oxidoreductases
MAVHVLEEAKRCLNCKKPLCRVGCPINTPIPQMIQTLIEGNLKEAGQMLFANNPLSLVCSLVCDHEKQCEGHCVLGRKGTPVQISSIENYISDTCFDKMNIEKEKRKGVRAAVIGSGPAGITIAIILAARGYDVTIMEAKDRIGGVLRYGIPEFRLPKTILDRYKQQLLDMGIKIRPNTSIGGAIGIDDMFRDGYKAIFIGTGVWRPNSLKIKGETLGNVHFAIDYLSNPDSYSLGNKVAIIGAGNSAMDVARTVIRKGSRDVSVFSITPIAAASPREVEYAQIDGVQFYYCKQAVEILDTGLVVENVTVDEAQNITPVPDTKELIEADSIIVAISQGPKNKIVSTTKGIDVNERGLLVTNTVGETTRDGIFASGDVVKGARTVVEAVAFSKLVADAMDEYMSKD